MSALALALSVPSVARAQSCSPNAPGQVAADGCAATVPGGSFTTTANSTPTFLAQNGGSITATAPVTLLTQGGTSFGVEALTGSTVTLNGGSVTTTGPNASDILLSNGSTITVTGVALATTSGGASGAHAINAGSIFIHGGTINSNTGGGTASILASGVGSQATGDQGLAITTSAVGAWALSGASINLDTVTITNSGNLPFVSGIRADAAGSTVTANNVSINLSSDFADGGALADGGGRIIIQNSTVTTSGVQGFGLHASLSDPSTSPPVLARIDATNVTITTTGESGIGVVASNGALVNLNNVNVSTAGATAYGLFVEGFLASGTTPIQTEIDGTGVTVHATGDTGYGAVVVASGVLNLTDSTLSATGPNAGGVFVSDTGSVAILTGSTVTSAQLDAGVVSDSAHLLVSNSVLSGNRNGVSSSGGTAADPNVISVSGGSLTAVNGDAFNAQDTIAQIALSNGTTVTAGSGNLLNVISTDPSTLVSDVTFNVQGITASGNIISDAASIATVNLTQNTTITGIELNTFTTIDSSSTWVMNGNSDIHSLTLAGQVLYTPPTGDPTLLSSYKTLTTGNFVGNGGLLGLNTFLGDDTAPSDRLVINGGNASGNALLRITNTTGPGALTTANGILVVDTINGGTTNPGTFSLANIVAAGAYEYLLFRGGVTPGSEQNWFLRSQLLPPPPPPPPPGPPPPPPPPPIPLFRPEAALYASLPAVARASTLATLDTFHERQGEQFLLRGNANFSAAWGRVFGQHTDQRFDGPFQQEFNGTITGFQAGIDLLGWEKGLHRDRAGLFAAFTQADMDVRGFAIAVPRAPVGSITLDSTSVGAYWTHVGPAAWYVDAVLMGTFFDSNARSIRGQFGISPDGTGITASVETGVPIWLGPAWTIEPQAQLIFQHVAFDDTADPFSRVSFHPDDAVTGRVGVRLTNTFQWLGATIQPYLRANLWHQFTGTDVTQFNIASFGTPLESTSVEVGGGVVASVNAALGLFATGSYVTDVGGVRQETFKGRLGMRYTW